MPRTARKRSATDHYHVIIRGIGRQILFEDDEDYQRFLSTVQRYRRELRFELIAYCLMENHVHMMIHDCNQQLDLIMKKIAGSYAYYFNEKYERVGHLFQDRYKSEPIEDDSYYLNVIRYIHNNPVKAGICAAAEYPWSSYRRYCAPNPALDNQAALDMMGGTAGFLELMKRDDGADCMDVDTVKRLSDRAAKSVMQAELGIESGTQLQRFDRKKRNAALLLLKEKGLSVRQIERLTGINRGIIQELNN